MHTVEVSFWLVDGANTAARVVWTSVFNWKRVSQLIPSLCFMWNHVYLCVYFWQVHHRWPQYPASSLAAHSSFYCFTSKPPPPPPTPAALPKSHITQPTWKCSVNFVFMERKTINKPKLLKCQIIEGTTRLPSAKSSSLNVICDSLYLQHWSRSFGFAGMQSGGQGILWQQHFIHKLDFDVDGYIPHSFFFREN